MKHSLLYYQPLHVDNHTNCSSKNLWWDNVHSLNITLAPTCSVSSFSPRWSAFQFTWSFPKSFLYPQPSPSFWSPAPWGFFGDGLSVAHHRLWTLFFFHCDEISEGSTVSSFLHVESIPGVGEGTEGGGRRGWAVQMTKSLRSLQDRYMATKAKITWHRMKSVE